MKINLIDLKKQYSIIKDEVNKSITEVLESTKFILGPNVTKFEEEVANYIGVKHGIGVANGTDALILTLEAYDIGQGDEVITSPFTFFASAEAISKVGATPIFVDVDEKTYNIDPVKIEEKITDKTKAIIPVHIFGQPADMDSILEIAERYNLVVIEDACQAIGAEYKSRKIGSLGHTACFSFFPTKNLGGYGDGGMVVTNNDEVAEKIKMLRFHGQKQKYHNEFLGSNSRLDELQAAILRVKLRYLDDWNNKRKELSLKYNFMLKETNLITPFEMGNVKHAYHLYIIQSEKREGLIAFLNKNGIETGIYYQIPLHLQKAYDNLGYKQGDFPVSEKLAERTFAIPLYPELSNIEQQYIVKKIKEFS